ncbi:S8 family serine peptidase [Aquisphaera insulae]|uniref:S8 family serine peptidase n=1 Tax=Aquisphaera insulae TaxID=2712864 RepID=UPI0013EA7E62|nr:S8 family serine peptidase [Aquisphaera insulae]
MRLPRRLVIDRTCRRGWRSSSDRPVARSLILNLDALERRELLTASSSSAYPLLVQLDTLPAATLTAWLADKDVSVSQSGLPQVMKVTGPDDVLTRMSSWLAGTRGLGYVERASALSIDQSANDPSFANGSMWGLSGTYGIGATTAWDTTTGATSVVVADLDTGADYNHPDLYQNIWINQQEIPATRLANLKDFDGDGLITFYDLNYTAADGSHPDQGAGKITDINGDGRIDASDILAPMQKNADGTDKGLGGWADGVSQDGDTSHLDDLVGWNFVNNTNDPFDDNGHGTHTAGTIGAIGNNGTGVTGINWRVQIMPLKFLDSTGNGSDFAAASALQYAADHGARISNNSYGGGDGGSILSTAITYAAGKGDVFVAAAGNSGANTDVTPNYPSGYSNDNIISVAAIGSDGTLASFSNYGATSVDIAAPGVGILSTYPNSRYASMSGTSMATPHVAGTAALLLALHPTWTYSQIIQRILTTTTADSAVVGKTVTGGILNAGAALTDPSAGRATYTSTDTTTSGNWQGTYGQDGYSFPAGSTSYPSYATVSVPGSYLYTWAGSTTDTRAPLLPGSTNRKASTWYSPTTFSFDVTISDGLLHPISLYALDWDGLGRAEQIQVVDVNSGKVLDTRTISGFQNGVYLTWKVSGHVQFRVTRTAGSNAVIGGLFFGYVPKGGGSAAFSSSDATTSGNWQGSFGQDGYSFPNGVSALPTYATASVAGTYLYTWASSTTDARAPLMPGSNNRVAATWYSPTSFTLDVSISDGLAHSVSLYALDWDKAGRAEQVQVVDPTTGSVLDTRTISGFQNGVYLTWKVSGHVQFRVIRTAGPNAVIGGLFFGSGGTAAAFSSTDATTSGSWQGTYGKDGYSFPNGVLSLPSYTTAGVASAYIYTWAASTTDTRAPLMPGSNNRVAATWYSPTSFTLDVSISDGLAHSVSLYALDWDKAGRAEQVQVVDPTTGSVLDTRTISGFQNGVYLTWKVSGHVQFRVTRTAGPNAVIGGLFFG